MKHIIIAPVGDNINALFIGIKEFSTELVILLSPKERLNSAKYAKNELEKFQIPCQIIEIKGDIWEEMFVKIAEIKEQQKNKPILINTATGDKTSTCAATSAAFVNGLKAFSVENNQVMLLPVLKFSYYKLLTEKKLKILEILAKDSTCCSSLEELSKKTGMSLPLISYHINGNLKSEGLKELGLVDIEEQRGKIKINLSMLGKLLIKGYIK